MCVNDCGDVVFLQIYHLKICFDVQITSRMLHTHHGTIRALYTQIMQCHFTHSSLSTWDTSACHAVQWIGYSEHYGTPWTVTVEDGHSCFAFHSLLFISQPSIKYCNTFFLGLTPRHWVIGFKIFDKTQRLHLQGLVGPTSLRKSQNKCVIVVLSNQSGHIP
jgi:hypothetical protein